MPGTIISYPEKLPGRAQINSNQLPLEVYARNNGTITNLLVSSQENILKGDTICIIGGQINASALLFLEQKVSYESDLLNLNVPSGYTFGPLQSEINMFISAARKYRQLTTSNLDIQKANFQKENLKNMNEFRAVTEKKIELLKKELPEAEERFEKQQGLYVDSIISKISLFRERELLNNKKSRLYDLELSLIQNNLNKIRLKEKIAEFKNRQIEAATTFKIQENQFKNNVLNYLNNLKDEYVLISPIDGVIQVASNIQEYVNVRPEELISTIVPTNDDYRIRAIVSARGAGAIQKGQRVRMAIDNYPPNEFGYLFGEVENINKVKEKGGYVIDISLNNNQLYTNYGKSLNYYPNMEGDIEIFTEDIRLIDHIIRKATGAIQN